MDFLKIKSVYISKERVKKMREQATLRENIWKHISDKMPIPSVYKELL